MNLTICIISGPDEGRTIKLKPSEPHVLGRSVAEGDGGLNDKSTSKKHCKLLWDGQTLRVEDLGSRNGTIVGGRKIDAVNVNPGETFNIGGNEILVQRVKNEGARLSGRRGPYPELLHQRMGDFEVGEIIAVGTTGVVFKAKDVTRDRTVALKVLRPEMSQQEEDLKRFVRSVKTMMPVKHPNLIETYNAGKNGPYCWVSMEYFPGENLAKVIQRRGIAGKMEATYALRVAVQIARALQIANANNIVHRNLTPRHILADRNGEAFKLTDLFLAKAIEGTMAINVSGEDELVGELEYMSPEQTRGTTELDIRSDIYGLGATIYALMAGRAPFEGRTPWEIINKIRGEKPDPVWQGGLGDAEYFTDAVLKMLAKDPADRYETPKELLAALERAAKFTGVTI